MSKGCQQQSTPCQSLPLFLHFVHKQSAYVKCGPQSHSVCACLTVHCGGVMQHVGE